VSIALDRSAVRYGRVRGRYFRENFAQGGIDLAQVVAELVTNADAAIAASGRGRGSIHLRVGAPDPEFRERWRRKLRGERFPALLDWRYEVCCTDDGEGLDAETVDRRLGALGVLPAQTGQRGLFGRGLRDVWMAQGGGRLQGIRAGRAVETWFFPAAADEPYAFVHDFEGETTPSVRRAFGIHADGARVTVPLALTRLPASGRLRGLATNLVQLRPILEDPDRNVWLELPDESAQLIAYAPPQPDPERPLLYDDEITVQAGIVARVIVRRAAHPIPLGPSRATRRGGLLVRSGRAAHEATFAGLEGHPGARHLYGEVRCEAIELLQRRALDSPRPQVVVKVDRSGLNENHAFVRRLYAAVEHILRPIVEREERRAGAHLVTAGRAVKARDEVGLRALNEALRSAFDAPGAAGFTRGEAPAARPPLVPGERSVATRPSLPTEPAWALLQGAMRFKHSPIRLHPGEQRTVSLLFDPEQVPPGSPIVVVADAGLSLRLWKDVVPEPGPRGWARVSGTLRARATVEPGSLLAVLAEAGEHTAELDVVIVRHRASGWVREIERKDEDNPNAEAEFDPDTGTVRVYEGRPEFRALERAARRAGLSRKRRSEYLPFRMLEVEVAANAVYAWAAERKLEGLLSGERPADAADYARAVRHEIQGLRRSFHEKLMRAFLEPEVFDGAVQIGRPRAGRDDEQMLLTGA
jgi:hypothetical protein